MQPLTGRFRLSIFITSLRDRCSNWNKSRNSVYNPTSQEVKKETIYTRKQDLQTDLSIVNRGGRCFIWYKNHIKQTFSILQVIYIIDTTPVDFILIVFL